MEASQLVCRGGENPSRMYHVRAALRTHHHPCHNPFCHLTFTNFRKDLANLDRLHFSWRLVFRGVGSGAIFSLASALASV